MAQILGGSVLKTHTGQGGGISVGRAQAPEELEPNFVIFFSDFFRFFFLVLAQECFAP